jgi:riboflavin biosynthesis pyrimidine reductase
MLFPDHVEAVDATDVYADVPTVDGRPALRLNMIVSVDGGTSWNGVSGALGGPADKALFAVLRGLTDVVLVASGTMRAERYGPAKLPEPVEQARVARGQAPVPAIAVVSRACDFDWGTPFFTEARARPVVVTVAGGPTGAGCGGRRRGGRG